jgi:hypothetical protein
VTLNEHNYTINFKKNITLSTNPKDECESEGERTREREAGGKAGEEAGGEGGGRARATNKSRIHLSPTSLSELVKSGTASAFQHLSSRVRRRRRCHTLASISMQRHDFSRVTLLLNTMLYIVYHGEFNWKRS